LYILHL